MDTVSTPTTNRKYPSRKRTQVKYYDDLDMSVEEEKAKKSKSKKKSEDTDTSDAPDSGEESGDKENHEVTHIDTPEISEYEKLRLKNIEENRKVMIELGLLDPKKEIKLKQQEKAKLKPKPKPKPKKPEESGPLKRSLRLLRKSSDFRGAPDDIFNSTPTTPEVTAKESKETRNTEAVLPMDAEGETIDFLDSLKQSLSQDSGISSVESAENLIEDLRKLQLADVRKVTVSRVHSLCVHPMESKLMVIIGSTSGELGLWSVKEAEVATFKPHSAPVACVSVCDFDSSKVFSTSHDGTVRRADLHKSVFDLIHETDEDRNMCHTTWHSQIDANTLMVAHGSGDVGIVDLRTKKAERWIDCHPRSVRTTHIHPTQPHYFLTSSGTGECKIWDLRGGGVKNQSDEPVGDLCLKGMTKGLTSAFFSPDGTKAVTTCNDDRIRIYDVCDVAQPKRLHSIIHDNHTGRWLSVFKANFHPLSSDLILVGSMLRPRRIQMYNGSGLLVQELKDEDSLTTVVPVIGVHPSLPIIVGGNSSGRAHFFCTPDIHQSQSDSED